MESRNAQAEQSSTIRSPWTNYCLNGLFNPRVEIYRMWLNYFACFSVGAEVVAVLLHVQTFPGADVLSRVMLNLGFACCVGVAITLIMGWQLVVPTTFVYFGRGAVRFAYENAPAGVYPLLWDDEEAYPLLRVPMGGWMLRSWRAQLFFSRSLSIPLKMQVQIVRGDVYLVWKLKEMTLRLSPPSMMELLGDAFAKPNPGMIMSLENVMYHAHLNREQQELANAAMHLDELARIGRLEQERMQLRLRLEQAITVGEHLTDALADKRWTRGSREIYNFRLDALKALHGLASWLMGPDGDRSLCLRVAARANSADPDLAQDLRASLMENCARSMCDLTTFAADATEGSDRFGRARTATTPAG